MSVPDVVSMTCSVPSSAPTNNNVPSGESEAESGVALFESERAEKVCVFTLNTITNGIREGGVPPEELPRM